MPQLLFHYFLFYFKALYKYMLKDKMKTFAYTKTNTTTIIIIFINNNNNKMPS